MLEIDYNIASREVPIESNDGIRTSGVFPFSMTDDSMTSHLPLHRYFFLHGIVPEGPESVLDIRHRLCRAIRSVASNPQNNNGKRKRAPHSTVSEANSAYIRSSCCVQCSLKSISAAYLHKICSTAFGVTFAASHFSYLEHHGSTLHHNQR